ncbi:SCF E3 ubiquitin ligase complex F-box protein pof2-like [Durio zibethinus]|uniref:SCF E3 ubiquitin ligase complex F-box protein pof2-like n=1 Tax=Durio zibethinus TaxID=66656 RepID=A0A6P5Z6W6_DURZI|nr:SCF E3 ubiquitin ligase complex F-box protein pof2-like [Durio zibethinus]
MAWPKICETLNYKRLYLKKGKSQCSLKQVLEFEKLYSSYSKEIVKLKMSELKPIPMEAVEILPIDCWQSIFNHLDNQGLKAVSLVCKDFLAISNTCKESLQVFHPGVGVLSEQLKRFKQLKRIHFKCFRGDINKAIVEIGRSDISLQVLDIWHREDEFKSESLKDLGSNLEVLSCCSLKGNLHDNDLVVIANSFPNLEQLYIGNCKIFPKNSLAEDSSSPQLPTDFGVEILASKLKLLTKICIYGEHYVSDRSVVALASNCVFLQTLTMWCSRNNGVTEHAIGFLLRNRPNLEALSIGYIKMDSSGSSITIENSISHAKALTSLEFYQMDVSDMLMNAIAKAELRLTKFLLKYCKQFTVLGLLKVLSNYQLTELAIVEANIADVDMELVLSRDVSKLTHIEISKCQVTNSTLFLLSTRCPSLVEIRMNQIALDGQINNGYNNFPLLKNHRVQNLCLTRCKISDELAKQLGLIFSNLKVLDLSYCYQLTSSGIEAFLKSCKFIRKLIAQEYFNAKIIEANNSELPEVNMESLILSRSQIDDEGLAAIAKRCPRLMVFDFRYCKKITAEGIKQIVKNISTMKYLYIRDCDNVKCGDLLEWMLSTGNLASLKIIYIGQNDLTEKHKDQFSHHGCLLL